MSRQPGVSPESAWFQGANDDMLRNGRQQVRVRPTTLRDLDFVIAAERDAENARYIAQWTHEEHRTAIASDDMIHALLERVYDARPVGYIIVQDVRNRHQSIQLRRLVVTEKNCGYGRQALRLIKRLVFEELHAHRLWLDVFETNQRAQHLYAAEGFVVEGTLRECYHTESGFLSLILMSCLRSEYEQQETPVVLQQ